MSTADLTESDHKELLRIARTTLIEYLDEGRIPPGSPHRASLLAPGAAFVTLLKDGDLRGCIGTQRVARPLYQTVQEMAVSAATRDPRFPPLTSSELPAVRIEISVLSAPQRFQRPDEIEIGRHGITIDHFGRRGLLLPQVASDAGWDAPTFLAHLCRKAGLPADAWKEAPKLEKFTADVFGEPEPA
jgi:AmmeMemoRadiSam system protein A